LSDCDIIEPDDFDDPAPGDDANDISDIEDLAMIRTPPLSPKEHIHEVSLAEFSTAVLCNLLPAVLFLAM
jgi:hypothetical protein